MYQDDGHNDLFLYYWIQIYPIGTDPDEDDEDKNSTEEQITEKKALRKEASIIKSKFNLREIYNTRNPLIGDKVYEKYKQKETYCPSVTHDFMEICYAEWNEGKHTVEILFYRIKEKWRLMKEELDIPEDKSLLTAIHRDITFENNIVDDWDNDFEYELNKISEKLSERKYYNLEKLNAIEAGVIKTKLYSHQLHNVNEMINAENNPKKRLITDDNLFFYKDGTRIYNYFRDEDTTWDDIKDGNYEGLELTKIKGVIIMDQVGIGKTLQGLGLITEQNYNRTQKGESPYKTICIVPDHLVDHWNKETKKHLKDYDEELTKIVSFSEFLKMNIKEGDYDRVIVDEIHELYSIEANEGIFTRITEMNFTFKHGLTGTPFPCDYSIFNLLLFLTDVEYDLDNMERFKWHFPIYQEIFLKNTLDNIDDEVNLPPLEENVEFLNFSQQEKILYESELAAKNDADEMFLRKLCCDVMINFKNKNIRILTLKDFVDVVLNDYRIKYEIEQEACDELTEIIEAIDVEVKEIKEKIKDKEFNLYEQKIEKLKSNKVIFLKKLQSKSQTRDNKKSSYNFLLSQIESKKECPVCLDEIGESDVYNMLPCGHIYCAECYITILGSKTRCDTCHKLIDKGQITQISSYSEKKMNYGTKINKLIILANDLIKKKKNNEVDSDKIIIYSQFPEMLQELIDILNSEKINSIIFNDTHDISKFKNDENIKCIVISSNKNAAGMDLSFVNNLVIYEPIKGTKSFLRDVEKQIIGRIYRINQEKVSNIYKFIINDTIEKQIYDELVATN